MEEEELELDFGEDDLFQQQSLELNNQQQLQQTYQRSPTPPRPHDSTLDANGNKLPPNWESRISSTKGDIYYKNLVNSKSSWEIPVAELPVVKSRDVATPPLPTGIVKALNRQEGSQGCRSVNKQREDSSSQPTSKFRSDPNFSETVAPYSPLEVQSALPVQKSTQPPSAPRGKQLVPGAPTGPKALVKATTSTSHLSNNRRESRDISPPPADAPAGPRRATNYLIGNNAPGNGNSKRPVVSASATANTVSAVEINLHTVISGPNDWSRRAVVSSKLNRDEEERDGRDREVQPPSGPKNPRANPIPIDQLRYKPNSSYPGGPKSFSQANSTKFEKKPKRGPANLSDLDAKLNFHASQRSPRSHSRSRSPVPLSRRRSRSRSRSPSPLTSNFVPRSKYRPGSNNSGPLPPRSPPPEVLTDAAMATMRQTLIGRQNLAVILETQERKAREKARRDGNSGREKSPIIASVPIVPPGGNNWARVKVERSRERSLSPPRGKRPEYRAERRRSRSRSPPPHHHHHNRQRSVSPPRHSRRTRSLSPPPPRHISSRNFRDRSLTPPPRRRQGGSRSRSPPPPGYRNTNHRGIIDTYRPERRQQDNNRDFRGGREDDRVLVKSQGELATGRGVITSGKGMFRVTKDDPLLSAIPMSASSPQVPQQQHQDNKNGNGNSNFRDRKRSRSRSPPPHLALSSSTAGAAAASLAARMNSSLPDKPNTLGARLGFDARKRNKGE